MSVTCDIKLVVILCPSIFVACSGSNGGGSEDSGFNNGGTDAGPSDAGASGQIGTDGGTLMISDGTEIKVPVGAIETNTTITIYPTNRSVGDLPKVVKVHPFEPAGLVFKTPVEVKIPFPAGTTGDFPTSKSF